MSREDAINILSEYDIDTIISNNLHTFIAFKKTMSLYLPIKRYGHAF